MLGSLWLCHRACCCCCNWLTGVTLAWRWLTGANRCTPSGAHTQPSWPMTSPNAGSFANNSVLRPSGLPPVRDRSMVDADVDRSARRLQPSAGRPASSPVVAVPAPAAGAAMCSVDRRLVRRELLTWAKKIPVVVGTSYYIVQQLTGTRILGRQKPPSNFDGSSSSFY